MPAFKPHVNPVQSQFFEPKQFFLCFFKDTLGIAVKAYAVYPRQILSDIGKDLLQPGIGDDKGISICEKDPLLVPAIAGGKGNIFSNGCCLLDPEANPLVGPAECTFVMGTADSDLQDNAVGLTGRPDYVALIVHVVDTVKFT